MVFPKPLQLMSEDERTAWVEQVVREDQVNEYLLLDYKEGLATSADKEQLAKDLSAFANTQGGVIIYGVPEEPPHSGRPSEDFGMEREPEFEARVANLLSASVTPPLPAVDGPWWVKVPSRRQGTGVYVLYHRESWDAPHMVIRGGDHRYYHRVADTNQPVVPMDERHVRDLYERRLRGRERAEQFLQTTDFGVDLILTGSDDRPRMATVVCPLLLRDNAVDVTALREWLASHIVTYSDGLKGTPLQSWQRFLGGARQRLALSCLNHAVSQPAGPPQGAYAVWRNGAVTGLERLCDRAQTAEWPEEATTLRHRWDRVLTLAAGVYLQARLFGAVRIVVRMDNVKHLVIGASGLPGFEEPQPASGVPWGAHTQDNPPLVLNLTTLAEDIIANKDAVGAALMDQLMAASGRWRAQQTG